MSDEFEKNENTQNSENTDNTENAESSMNSENPETAYNKDSTEDSSFSQEKNENSNSERVFRVNEEYISPENTSERKAGGKQGRGIGKKILGVASAVVVFGAVSGGLIWASEHLSGTGGNGSSSGDTNIAGLTKEDETKESVKETESGKTTSLIKQESEISSTNSVSASLLDVSSVVDEVMPTVVAVTNTTVYSANGGYWSWFGSSQNSDKTASGAGSGVIIADNGEELLVVTNAHVVNPTDYSDYGYTVDTSKISISFCNDTTVDAVVKGVDTDADLAVIAVDLDDIDKDTMSAIKIATVGNSDELKVGNGVIAIGNALGFGQSVTVGYVSAVNRDVTIDNVTRTLLQTDAAINPGNSGGGLFNTNGMLIGINSAKYASEDVEGIGYAIPITKAESIITELMNKETVVREKVTDEDKMSWLGIASDKQYSSFYDGQGAFISSVVEGGPAEKAGLMAYDIITAVGDVEINSMSALQNELAYHEGGETVKVTYYTLQESGGRREYVEKETEVTLGFKKDMPKTDSTEKSTEK